MNSAERHRLHDNDIALALGHAREFYARHRSQVLAVIALVIVGGGGALGYLAWSSSRSARAGEALAAAMIIVDARVQAPPPPGTTAPGEPTGQPAGTYPTEKAKLEAALPKLLAAADAHEATPEGRLARFHAAAALVGLGKYDEAIAQYGRLTGGRDVLATTAALGRAEAQVRAGKYDDAIVGFRTLSGVKDGPVPVDGVLMQLARACVLAGKPQDARTALTQLTEQHPDSPFASEARQELDRLKG